jgi:large subunit ribosomal protein L13
MSTFSARTADNEHKWFVVDANGMVLGRLASEVAKVIRGKHKPTFTPHIDTGDNVIVVNAAKVKLTGRKAEQKTYFTHSGYMGHDKLIPVSTVLAKHPERVIEKAVFGMLPKNALSRQVLRLKLRVYPGAEHPHAGQRPTALTFATRTSTARPKAAKPAKAAAKGAK